MNFSLSSYAFICWLLLFTGMFRPLFFVTISSKTSVTLKTSQSMEELFDKKFSQFHSQINEKIEKLTSQVYDYHTQYEELRKSTDTLSFTGFGRSTLDTFGRSSIDRHYMYKDAIIYHDIFDAFSQFIMSKIGDPQGWDETSYKVNPWNKRRIIKIGNADQSDGNGISAIIPEGYNVIWFRVLNERWTVFRAKFIDGNKEDLGKFSCGYRQLNEYSPDGTTPDTMQKAHMWCQIPTRRAGRIGIFSEKNSDTWISGIAFSKNLWNHARNSAVGYHWAINGGTPARWTSESWNLDNLAFAEQSQVYEFRVPVVPSGLDKLVYIVEHNSTWMGTQHTNVWVNGIPIERFRTTYSNPFAIHYNSKVYDRYMAARVPADLIKPGDTFITLKLDMSMADLHLHFREIGTHDIIY